MVREAELEEMEKKWKAQNEEIMRRTAISAEESAGQPVMTGPPPVAKEAQAEVQKADEVEATAPPPEAPSSNDDAGAASTKE